MAEPAPTSPSFEQLLARLPLTRLFSDLYAADFQITPRHFTLFAGILAQDPTAVLQPSRARRILRALIAKSPQECIRFDEVFWRWRDDAGDPWTMLPTAQATSIRPPENEGEAGIRDAPPTPTKKKEIAAAARRPKNQFYLYGALTTLLGLVLFGWLLLMQPAIQTPLPPLPSSAEDAPAELPRIAPDPFAVPMEARSILVRIPELVYSPLRHPILPWLGLFILATSLATLVYERFRRRSQTFAGQPKPISSERVRVGEPSAAGFHLLSASERQTMIWGVGKFQTEIATTRIDTQATVRATADNAGILTPVFEGAKAERTVWLWLDDACADPAAPRLFHELHTHLKSAGIAVETARFYAGMDELSYGEPPQPIRPRDLEATRTQLLVVILTDGVQLRRLLDTPDTGRVRRTLRALQHWPRLTLVDFSSTGDLQALAQRYRLSCLKPESLSHWLGQLESQRAPVTNTIAAGWGNTGIWAAASALPEDGCSEPALLAIPGAMRLEVPGWALRQLVRPMRHAAGRYAWAEEDRRTRLAWLRSISAEIAGDAAAGRPTVAQAQTPLAEAVGFWQARYRHSLKTVSAQDNSIDALDLRLRLAMLDLWVDPLAAARTLADLAQRHAEGGVDKVLHTCIRRWLSRYAPCDRAGAEHIALPWRAAQIPEAYRLLNRLGLGNAGPEVVVTRPPGFVFGGVGLIGCAFGILLAAMLSWVAPVTNDVQTLSTADVTVGVLPDGDNVRAFAQYQHGVVWRDAAHGQRVNPVLAEPEPVDCVASIDGGHDARRRLCARQPAGPRMLPRIARRVAVLLTEQLGMASVDRFADGLLIGGTVDEVIELAGPTSALDAHLAGWRRVDVLVFGTSDRLARLGGALRQRGVPGIDSEYGMGAVQVYATEAEFWIASVVVDDWRDAAGRLKFPGSETRRLGEVFGVPEDQTVTAAAADILVGSSRVTIALPTMRQIPPDVSNQNRCFQMGDASSTFSDERPVHEVCVQGLPFLMSIHEVTFEQYDAYVLSSGGQRLEDEALRRSDRPVNVSWYQAREYAQWLSGRVGRRCGLPSESEWEYAARADTRTDYYWADDPGLANDYAWFGQDLSLGSQPVGEKSPNPWGLYDVSGNVWEWVEDVWHENYVGAPADGSAWVSDGDRSQRVLRGGAWLDTSGGPVRNYVFVSHVTFPDGGYRHGEKEAEHRS